MTFTERASLLTSRHIPVVPVEPNAKRCTLPNWPSLASTVPQWTGDYNTAAVCLNDGICVLDSDSADLAAQLPHLPETFTVRSASKQLPHYYFHQTDRSRALGNRSAAGLFDFQQHRKYVVGPGSVVDGRSYDVANDAPIADFPDWLADFIEQRTQPERKPSAAQHVDPDFDFYEMLEHYGITGDDNGSYFITDVCPVAGRKHAQSTETGFYFDGTTLGFKCFAANCDGSHMSAGQVLSYLNRTHAPYPGTIWPNFEPTNLPDMMHDGVIYQDQAALDAAKAKGTKPDFKYPAQPWSTFQYVVNPICDPKKQRDGWFSRGQVNIIAGSSGAGKTRWMLPLLRKARDGERLHERDGAGLPFTVIFADRGPIGNQETIESLDLQDAGLDIRHMPVMLGLDAVKRIQYEMEKHSPEEMPKVWFIEGADALVEDPNKAPVVAAFLSPLGALATHYNVAIILSLGAGKKANDAANSRDRAFGSIMWQRLSAQMFILTQPADDTEDRYRTLTINYRNWQTEKLDLEWHDGTLIKVVPVVKEEQELSRGKLKLFNFIQGEVSFTLQRARTATKMNGKSLAASLDAYERTGHIKRNKRGDYEVQPVRFTTAA